MIKLGKKTNISFVPKKEQNSSAQKNKERQVNSAFRPQVVDAKVYKVKSAFVKNSVFITLSYVDSENGRKPIEIFINSKDLNRAPEYVVLTRLISAIFRRATDPMFILEELQGIFDPNGGSFKKGKYYHSFYGEIAEVIERFFFEVNILEKPVVHPLDDNGHIADSANIIQNKIGGDLDYPFKICPDCNNPTLKI